MAKRSVVVVGAGVFGAWSALRLARAGWQVTLLDAYGPANGRASSSDHSRVIRASYGADEIYTHWATASLADWHWLSARAGEPLAVECGALLLGEAGSAALEATHRTLNAAGVAHERLTAAQVASRFPQLGVIGLGEAIHETRGGVLRARRAVAAAVTAAQSYGARYAQTRVLPFDEHAATPRLRLDDGRTLEADHVVLACGPWLPALLPQAVGARIRPTRQEVLYFGVPAGDPRFGAARLPAWVDFEAGLYGIPDLDAHGFKVGIDRHGAPIDPDSADRLAGAETVQLARDFFARRFPALLRAPLVDAHVCQYENTTTGDFLIDRHPQWPNVWIAGGGSGHGFKHGPAVGAHVADLVAGRAQVQARFALAGKSTAAARAVF